MNLNSMTVGGCIRLLEEAHSPIKDKTLIEILQRELVMKSVLVSKLTEELKEKLALIKELETGNKKLIKELNKITGQKNG